MELDRSRGARGIGPQLPSRWQNPPLDSAKRQKSVFVLDSRSLDMIY